MRANSEAWSYKCEARVSHLLENPVNPNIYLVTTLAKLNQLLLFDIRTRKPCLDLSIPMVWLLLLSRKHYFTNNFIN